ncbi:hypothetical protein PESP_a1014 [Pseudoalteromonas espejiana DSM 9414]|uniref:Uncharacterized protein n=1 Tax=Pseudoalteromonas espejiana TaxID=28107 RepID=A0A510XUM8_9GAMM|nr:hypothetical protein [Pseudoalteromonas espejiana]ASM49185.1 hypothetical protein PESP_a1014 [Pseudoalteromonas espejiana DSM 9414]GEK54756.1 hypothetical protein PES01_16010 [Pseudoalteromonas espejiana]
MSQERSFIKSGRNTIIHKDKKLDLVIVNSELHPRIKVTQNGLEPFKEELPKNRRDAKERYLEMVYVSSADVFGEEKQLLFIQALDGREYKVDYSKIGTKLFVRIHQDTYM